MTIAYPVANEGRFVIGADDEIIARVSLQNGGATTFSAHRIAAALNYTQDLTDDQLTEDSAGIVREDRDRLLTAIRNLQPCIKAAVRAGIVPKSVADDLNAFMAGR